MIQIKSIILQIDDFSGTKSEPRLHASSLKKKSVACAEIAPWINNWLDIA